MLRQDQNDLLTQTGPGTPMGRLFRSYWIPALLPEELPENDCPPVRVKLLSERLIAFRDSEGRYGLMDEFCAHRGVSLWFGRNEECGLRCPYHGWKYDVTGQCIDMPSEPEESTFARKVKLKSYPLVERGGVLWTYMGPPDAQPPLPEWEFATVPAAQSFMSKRFQECNWLQAMEGGIDSSHVSFLHRGDLNTDPLFKGARGNQYNLSDTRPVFEVVESPGGLYIGARRNAENGNYYWRITQWVMPSFTMIPPRGNHSVHGHFWIPIDDENCWTWSFDYHPTRALTDEEVAAMRAGKGIHVKYDPGHLSPAREQGQRLPDGPRRAEGGKNLQRHRRLCHAGRVAPGKHGADRRSHEGDARLDRQRHHHGAAAAPARGEGAGRERRDPAGRRSGAPARPLGLGRAAAGSAVQGRRARSADRAARRGAGVGLTGSRPFEALALQASPLGVSAEAKASALRRIESDVGSGDRICVLEAGLRTCSVNQRG